MHIIFKRVIEPCFLFVALGADAGDGADGRTVGEFLADIVSDALNSIEFVGVSFLAPFDFPQTCKALEDWKKTAAYQVITTDWRLHSNLMPTSLLIG